MSSPLDPLNSRLTEQDIRDRILRHPVEKIVLPENLRWRRAAVLIPMIWQDDGWHLLFIRRTEQVAEHKGQVAFPGGAVDPEDETPEDTALREAYEEVGLQPAHVRVLGRLSDYYTITNYLITPVVGVIPWPYPLQLSREEVSRAFTIPLAWLADPAHWEQRLYTRANGSQEWVIFYQLFNGENLWGVTGRITVNFLKILNQSA